MRSPADIPEVDMSDATVTLTFGPAVLTVDRALSDAEVVALRRAWYLSHPRPKWIGPWRLGWWQRQEPSCGPDGRYCLASDPVVRVRQWARWTERGVIFGPEIEREDP